MEFLSFPLIYLYTMEVLLQWFVFHKFSEYQVRFKYIFLHWLIVIFFMSFNFYIDDLFYTFFFPFSIGLSIYIIDKRKGRNKSRLNLFFYSVLAVLTEDIIIRLTGNYIIFELVNVSLYSYPRMEITTTIQVILTFIIFNIVFYVFQIDFKYVRLSKNIFKMEKMKKFTSLFSYVLLVGYNTLAFFNDNFYPESDFFLLTRKLVILIYFIILISILVYISHFSLNDWKNQIIKDNEEQIKTINNYSSIIEEEYEAMRLFKHDYKNILLTIGESIRTGDINLIEEQFDKVMDGSLKELNNANCKYSPLSRVKDLSIKSLLINKIKNFDDSGGKFLIEIESEWSTISKNDLSFIRILGILLDNAIEEAMNTKEKTVQLIFTNGFNNEIILIIYNSCHSGIVEERIIKKGFSTKGENRGLGLYSVSKILSKQPNWELNTVVEDKLFKQILTIR